jgi:hypothetical protein
MTALKRIFADAHRQLRPRSQAPEIQAEFFPFAGLNHTIRRRSGRVLARVSDIFRDAPPEVVRAVASMLLARLYRQRIDPAFHERYRRYILSERIQQRAHAARRERGRPIAVGQHADLQAMFDRLNERHFDGKLPRPTLSWSRVVSRRILGRYDAARDAITISRLFDSPDVPQYVTEYILFHEMLHMSLRSRADGARLVTHSSQFRAAEQAFPSYGAATAWLDSALGAA